jgi:uncharacterized protein DUF4011
MMNTEGRHDEQPRPQVSEDCFQGDIRRGIERMRMRLLDLSNRTRLLNFRHTKRSTLEVVGESPESICSRLRDGVELFFQNPSQSATTRTAECRRPLTRRFVVSRPIWDAPSDHGHSHDDKTTARKSCQKDSG